MRALGLEFHRQAAGSHEIWFHPALPGKKFSAKKSLSNKGKSRRAQVGTQKFGSLEEVAFYSASQLGELIRARQMSPVELTKM